MAFDFSTLVTDRTEADVARVEELADKIQADEATSAELAEWNSLTMKGTYNYTDLNRVGKALVSLAGLLNGCGYTFQNTPKTDWAEEDCPTPDQMDAYLGEIARIRAVLAMPKDTPGVPADIETLTVEKANDIERILQVLEQVIPAMSAVFLRSAQPLLYCGFVMYPNSLHALKPGEAEVGYVSLGDSIAAGHTINADWGKNYGEGSQYGKNGNTETAVVPGCYTDIISKELKSVYGDHAFLKSFARSGDTVEDLMNKLTHETVREAIKKADLVTICIGANDVLQPAMSRLDEYIDTGSLANAEAVIEANMTRLASDAETNSYRGLFDRLAGINPDAKFVFTTIYNPYKYLYLEGGHHGFFGPLLQMIPTMEIDVDEIIEDLFNIDDLGYYDVLEQEWVSIELKADIDSLIKGGLLATPIVQKLFDRVNGLSAWSEDRVNRLNEVLRGKITEYQAINPNFHLVDTKAAFDLFPDKTDSNADVDYSDLVNVEFTATYDTAKMDWGALWPGSNAETFWWDLSWKHLSFENALPSTNVWDYVSFDLNSFAEELTALVIEKVILPNVDPHPEHHGHEVMKRVFTNAFGFVKYDAAGGLCNRGNVVTSGEKAGDPNPWKRNHIFEGWYADAAHTQVWDSSRADLTDPATPLTLSALVNGNIIVDKPTKTTTLYAKWFAI